MKAKIVILAPSIDGTKGGIATVVRCIMESELKNQYQFVHIVTHSEGTIPKRILQFIKSLWQLLLVRDVNLVHIHVACYGSFIRKALLAFVAKAKGIPIIYHVHGSDFDDFFTNASFPLKWFIRTSLRSANAVLVLSEYWLDFFSKEKLSDHVSVLHNGVDSVTFESCRTSTLNINNFLFLGRLGQRKGVYDLLEALDVLVNQFGRQQLHFYLAGDGEIEEVRKLVKQKQLSKFVTVLGWTDDDQKKIYLQCTATLVLPSYSEGLPMSILESMASGKVIISTDVGGIPDVITQGVNGFLVKPGDVSGLVNYISYVIDNPDLMESICNANVEKIQTSFDLNQINRLLGNFYQSYL